MFSLFRCNHCGKLSLYQCCDCNTDLCKDCFRQNHLSFYPHHFVKGINDSFLLKDSFNVNVKPVNIAVTSDIKCLPNGDVIVADVLGKRVMTFSVIGKQKHVIQLKYRPKIMNAVDNNTIAVSLYTNNVAIINIEKKYIEYINSTSIKSEIVSLTCIKKEIYVGDGFSIVVMDILGHFQRRIELKVRPYDMCFDVQSQLFYCIDEFSRKLISFDCDATITFTFPEPDTNTNCIKRFTLDNDGNMLVLSKHVNDELACVIKVYSKGKASDVVISNVKLPQNLTNFSICFHHSSKSVLIGVDATVYVYTI
ncbi:Hypothetical predicted protein [Mytilus galloprovincialis]|uniref:B box-type domain-containing protein n=1 Tax=Mytilus galloprovincialis TaxID=29158 RepID=A0A8B6GVM6_MYTGA|nr:Hypothetical predicted protein [Mytilus galloprovincialis]